MCSRMWRAPKNTRCPKMDEDKLEFEDGDRVVCSSGSRLGVRGVVFGFHDPEHFAVRWDGGDTSITWSGFLKKLTVYPECPFCKTELTHLKVGEGGWTSSSKATPHDCPKWDRQQADP